MWMAALTWLSLAVAAVLGMRPRLTGPGVPPTLGGMVPGIGDSEGEC